MFDFTAQEVLHLEDTGLQPKIFFFPRKFAFTIWAFFAFLYSYSPFIRIRTKMKMYLAEKCPQNHEDFHLNVGAVFHLSTAT